MAFKQGREPCLVVPKKLRSTFRGDLFALGYKPHTGLRTRRRGEVQAWLAPLSGDRQVHVQEERLANGDLAIFAHTEPAGIGIKHLLAAVLDHASFSGGARALLGDLRRRGWDV